MTATADIITGLIAEAAPRIAVVFAGTQPRLIGTLDHAESAEAVKAPVDAMLVSQHLTARCISRAECRGQMFVAAHG